MAVALTIRIDPLNQSGNRHEANRQIVTKQIFHKMAQRCRTETRTIPAQELRHAQFLRSLAQIHIVDLRDAALLLAVEELVS